MNKIINLVLLAFVLINLNAMEYEFGRTKSKKYDKALSIEEINLFKAAKEGDEKLLNQLIENGVNSNIGDQAGDTPLIYSAKYDRENITKKLLKIGGIDINVQNNDGDAALIIAAKKCHEDVLKILLDKRIAPKLDIIDLNLKNNAGNTALLEALKSNCFPAIELLIGAGADINLINNKNENALILIINGYHYIKPNSPFVPRQWKKQNENIEKIIKLLKNKKISLNIIDALKNINLNNYNLSFLWSYKDENENNILHQIVDSNLDIKTKEAMIKALLKFPENRDLIQQKNKQKLNPIEYAISKSQFDILKIFMDLGYKQIRETVHEAYQK